MKKITFLSIAFLLFTNYIETCENKRVPLARDVIYKKTTWHPLLLRVTSDHVIYPVTDVVGKNIPVYFKKDNVLQTVMHRGKKYKEDTNQEFRLVGIRFSDTSVEAFRFPDNPNLRVIQVPFFKGEPLTIKLS